MSTNTEKQVKKFNNYMCGLLGYAPEYNFTDKQQCIRQHISYMLNTHLIQDRPACQQTSVY